jgi:uncharacterized protein (TIGR03435 family)
MKSKPLAFASTLLAAATAWGQAAAPLSFEVASVKQVTPNLAQPDRRVTVGPSRIDFPGVTLWYCISYAYGMKSYQMSGPDWLRQARYEIEAKGPDGATREDLPRMMQTLLRDRFQLQTHQETRDIAVLLLAPDKDGPKLKDAAPGSGDGQGGAQVAMSASETGGERLEIHSGAMSTLANTLTGLLGRPVVDQTGLAGRYDFTLDFSRTETAGSNATGGFNEPPALPPPPPGAEPGVSIYNSIRELGLRLVPQKRPMPVLVIDRANKEPTAN